MAFCFVDASTMYRKNKYTMWNHAIFCVANGSSRFARALKRFSFPINWHRIPNNWHETPNYWHAILKCWYAIPIS
jgi:hypothetical protein